MVIALFTGGEFSDRSVGLSVSYHFPQNHSSFSLFLFPMPEGPSIVLLREAADKFTGKKVLAVTGNTTLDKKRMLHKKVIAFKTWGKHFLVCFNGFTMRVHFLMIGSYLIDDNKEAKIRLGFRFSNGTLQFYASNLKYLEGEIDDHYDWTADVMNEDWDPAAARKKLRDHPDTLICDALLDQTIFGGVGNIIKNEVLYRVRVHPESTVGSIPADRLRKLVTEARTYSFQFLDWKRDGVLAQHWLAHEQQHCTRCDLPLHKEYTGKQRRRSYFCTNCQVRYT